jgi:quinohemoprotein amine dehydrogenase
LFTPNVDGPNPKRSGNRNNVGDVWVVAELAGARPIRARAHLLVTVPVYMNWFSEANTSKTNGSPAARQ